MLTEFGHFYQSEKSKVFSTLWSCKTEPQLRVAENFFQVLKNKWKIVTDNNTTIKTLVEIDELQFYRDLQFRSVELGLAEPRLFI